MIRQDDIGAVQANKRTATDTDAVYPVRGPSLRRPEVPHDVAVGLVHVGSRVRKQVSDGHMTSSTQASLSYRGEAVGPSDRVSIERDFAAFDSKAFRSKSAIETGRQGQGHRTLKRPSWDDEEDTDVDDELPTKPGSMGSLKAYFVPRNYVARQATSLTEDFEDAEFLQPRQDLG